MANLPFRKALADSTVPPRWRASLLNWVEGGILGGEFTRALVQGDLVGLTNATDPGEWALLQSTIKFLQVHAPIGAFFEPECLHNWPLYLAASERQKAFAEEVTVDLVTKELINGR